MRQVTTNALEAVAAALGIGAPVTATEPVDFDDGVLQQVFDVAALVRRARAGVAGTGGLGVIQLTNTHPGAGTLTAVADVYNIGSGAPNSFPEDTRNLDIWAFGARARATAGGGGLFTNGRLQVGPYPIINGTLSGTFELQNYDAEVTLGAAIYLAEVGSGLVAPRWAQAVRIPRNANVSFQTVATAASTYTCDLFIGVFPRGIGQDALGAG